MKTATIGGVADEQKPTLGGVSQDEPPPPNRGGKVLPKKAAREGRREPTQKRINFLSIAGGLIFRSGGEIHSERARKCS